MRYTGNVFAMVQRTMVPSLFETYDPSFTATETLVSLSTFFRSFATIIQRVKLLYEKPKIAKFIF